MPPQKMLDQSKRAKNFINSKGYPRYCTTTPMSDGSVVLNAGRSRRGKMRGPPGSKDWATALKACDDADFIDFVKKCLEWDPLVRMNPYTALRHTWLTRRRLPRPPQNNDTSAAVSESSPVRYNNQQNAQNAQPAQTTNQQQQQSTRDAGLNNSQKRSVVLSDYSKIVSISTFLKNSQS